MALLGMTQSDASTQRHVSKVLVLNFSTVRTENGRLLFPLLEKRASTWEEAELLSTPIHKATIRLIRPINGNNLKNCANAEAGARKCSYARGGTLTCLYVWKLAATTTLEFNQLRKLKSGFMKNLYAPTSQCCSKKEMSRPIF